jgi:hypothetical protein
MRARFINEIKRGDSGWSGMGVGGIVLCKFHHDLTSLWPKIKELYTILNELPPAVNNRLYIIEKYLDCPAEDLAVLQISRLSKNIQLWISKTTWGESNDNRRFVIKSTKETLGVIDMTMYESLGIVWLEYTSYKTSKKPINYLIMRKCKQ